MRFSTIVPAAFAATAIAGPAHHQHHNKRAYVTDITYVTVTVYVTAGQEPTPSVQAYTPHSHKPKSSSSAVYVAPSSTPVYVAPSSTPVYVAPSSAAAPVYSSSSAPAYTPPASSQVESSAAPVATGYEAVILRHHNVHRANHSAADLVWNQTLADAAYSWASQCNFAHHVDGYGQNLAASLPNANVSAQLSEGWYNGEAPNFTPYYDIASPAVSTETFETYGHFTQMVWKDTTSVGCATYDCQGASGDFKMWYTVCNYYPAGNYGGEYAANIGRPRGDPTCHWDD